MTSSKFLRPVVVAVAPNGGRRTQADHPKLPLTPWELANTAQDCLAAGAAMIHLHVRTKEGRHLLDPDAYREAIEAIRAVVGDRMVVQITSESLGVYRPAEQRAVIRETRPEAASLALRELVPTADEETAFADLLAWMRRERVRPQIILYGRDEARRLADMHGRGMIPFDSIPVLFVLGRYTSDQTSAPIDLMPFLALEEPRLSPWSCCAFGRHEMACVVTGALLGGHVRVGFENNLHRPDGTLATSNGDLVSLTANAIRDFGLSLATADQARRL